MFSDIHNKSRTLRYWVTLSMAERRISCDQDRRRNESKFLLCRHSRSLLLQNRSFSVNYATPAIRVCPSNWENRDLPCFNGEPQSINNGRSGDGDKRGNSDKRANDSMGQRSTALDLRRRAPSSATAGELDKAAECPKEPGPDLAGDILGSTMIAVEKKPQDPPPAPFRGTFWDEEDGEISFPVRRLSYNLQSGKR